MRKPKLQELTLREKIGQTVVFRHILLGNFKTVEEIKDYFSKNPVGATWPMWHPTEFYSSIESSRGNAELKGYKDEMFINYINIVNKQLPIPLILATDARSGIASGLFPGHEPLPEAISIGVTRDPEVAYRYAKAIGEDIKSIGINWIWSPVADNAGVFKDTRHLSADTEANCTMLKAFICGLHHAGVASGAKHFPGVDPYEYRDSHFCTSSYSQSFEEWERTQGREFQACIDAGVDGIMIAHRTFKAVDDTRVNGKLLPATVSHKIITGLLKEKMGFKGVVITDDVKMKSLTQIYPTEQLYVELLRAGVDLVCGPLRLDYIDIVEKAVLNGELPESRIDDACQRVLDLKEKYGIFDRGEIPYPTEEVRERIRLQNKLVSQDIAKNSITLTANRTGFLPVSADKIRKVKVIYIGYSGVCYENLKYLAEEFEKHGAVCDIEEGVYDNTLNVTGNFDLAKESGSGLEEYDLIIYATHIGFLAPAGGPFFFEDKCRAMTQVMIEAPEKSIGVSFGNPDIFFNYFSAAHTFINAYSFTPETMRCFVKGLYGEIKFSDYSPFPLNPITRTNEVY